MLSLNSVPRVLGLKVCPSVCYLLLVSKDQSQVRRLAQEVPLPAEPSFGPKSVTPDNAALTKISLFDSQMTLSSQCPLTIMYCTSPRAGYHSKR